MSDGPYKSLPMSRAWKRVAEFAQNENFETADICDAAIQALTRDWHANVPAPFVAAIRSAFLTRQTSLFAEQNAEHVQAFSDVTGVRGFGKLFADCATAVLASGESGESGLIQAASDALLARAARGVRQVEEHYYRKAPTALARTVRARLEAAITGTDLHTCAYRLLKVGREQPIERGSRKHEGLDDGVPM